MRHLVHRYLTYLSRKFISACLYKLFRLHSGHWVFRLATMLLRRLIVCPFGLFYLRLPKGNLQVRYAQLRKTFGIALKFYPDCDEYFPHIIRKQYVI